MDTNTDTDSTDTPIARIPPELLGEIFCHCTAFCSDAPIVLSAVCSNFREVVRRTPPVWTRLRVTYRQQHRTKEALKAALWFDMARNCPMSLYVALNGVEDIPVSSSRPLSGAVPGEGDAWYADYFSRVPCAKTIQDNVPRIQAISIRSSSERAAHKFLHFLYPASSSSSSASSSSSLHRLTLNVTGDSPLPYAFSPIVVPLPPLPSLRSLKLTNHSFPQPSANVTNLRSFFFVRPLRAAPIPYADILRLLHANPALVDVQIECRLSDSDEAGTTIKDENAADHDSDDSTTSPPRVFALTHLTHLSLRTNHLPLLLNTLILPSLTHLNIDDLDGKNPEHHLGATLRGLIVRSALGTHDGNIRISSLCLTNTCMFTHAITSWEGDEVPVWQWCFSRMGALEELAMMNTDGAEHVGMLHLLADAASHMPSLDEAINSIGEAELEEGLEEEESSIKSGNSIADADRATTTRHSPPPPPPATATTTTTPPSTPATAAPTTMICPHLKSLRLSAPFVIDPFAISKLKQIRPDILVDVNDDGLDGVNGYSAATLFRSHAHNQFSPFSSGSFATATTTRTTTANANANANAYANANANFGSNATHRLFSADRFIPLLPLDHKPHHHHDHHHHHQSAPLTSSSPVSGFGFGFGSRFDSRRKTNNQNSSNNHVVVRSHSALGRYHYPETNTTKAESSRAVVMSLLPGDENLW